MTLKYTFKVNNSFLFSKGFESYSSLFSFIVRNGKSRTEFVQNVLQLVKQIKFDGLDIHWEYPGIR